MIINLISWHKVRIKSSNTLCSINIVSLRMLFSEGGNPDELHA